MKVLMLSTDANILETTSSARDRMERYAVVLGELHVVVVAPRAQAEDAGKKRSQAHTGNLFLSAACGGIFARLIKAYRILSASARRMSFDVVTAQAPDEVGIIAWLVARRFKIPLQIQIHTDILSPWYRRASWKERIRYWLATFLIPRAGCVRVVSKRIKESLVSGFGFRVSGITALPIFTDVSKFLEAKEDPDTRERFHLPSFKMIAAGRFVDKEKNFSMLIDMMRDFVAVCPAALLVLVGDGPDGEKYESRIKNYKLEKNVIMEPWRDDLPAFYKSFDLFLLSSNYEGWGRAVVEAMASGLAAVMTDVGLAGEVAKDRENAMVVPVGDRAGFLDACETLYHDSILRQRLSEEGARTATQMHPRTWNEYLEEYKKSFTSCA